MKKTVILYVGRNPAILDTVVRLLNGNEGWTGIGVHSEEQAREVFLQADIDLVLLGPGIGEEEENRLADFFRDHKPRIRIIRHYGGGSGLLSGEILQALQAG